MKLAMLMRKYMLPIVIAMLVLFFIFIKVYVF
jgi:hypothetical protein